MKNGRSGSTWLDLAHQKLDRAVLDAYGWPHHLTDEEILQRLVDLNAQRAAEEANGYVRWLHPEYQAPGEVQPQQGTLVDLSTSPETQAAPVEKQEWPQAL